MKRSLTVFSPSPSSLPPPFLVLFPLAVSFHSSLSLMSVVFIPRPLHRLFYFHHQAICANECDTNKVRQDFGSDWLRIAPLELKKKKKTKQPSPSQLILFKISWLLNLKNKLFLWEVNYKMFNPPPSPWVTNTQNESPEELANSEQSSKARISSSSTRSVNPIQNLKSLWCQVSLMTWVEDSRGLLVFSGTYTVGFDHCCPNSLELVTQAF